MHKIVQFVGNQVGFWHILVYALYDTYKFQNFDLKQRGILPHCLKVMAPLSKILKIWQLFDKNVLPKVVGYYLRMFAI